MGLTAHQILQKKKISELEDIAIETIPKETQRNKAQEKMKRASVNCGTTAISLACILLEVQKGKRNET